VVDSHSVTLRALVFHYERWWDEADPLHSFRFKAGEKYRVAVAFQVNTGEVREFALFDMPVYDRADVLDTDRSKSWWDFWYLE